MIHVDKTMQTDNAHDQFSTRSALMQSQLPRIDAELLLMHVLQLSRSQLYAHPQQVMSASQWQGFQDLARRRHAGEPLAYITGEREFWSLSFRVTPATLIPRPETELLVEQALVQIPVDEPCHVADLGTGSGAIAVAIAHERPRARVIATDFSPAAIEIARANARRHDCKHIEFRTGDWLAALGADCFDVIVANPPYVAANDPALDNDGVRFEPLAALVAGADGLDDLRAIIAAAAGHLHPGGWLLLEHGADQAAAVSKLLTAQRFSSVDCVPDLAGHGRLSIARHEN